MTPKHLSREEVARAIRALTRKERLFLARAGERLARGTALTGEDLVQEALLRVIAGSRPCPRDLDFVQFLLGVMRSRAWVSREQIRADPLAGAMDVCGSSTEAVSAGDSPEEQLVAKRDYKARQQALIDLFTGDEEALWVLLMLFEGKSSEEIRAARKLDDKAYATIRRRMRRKIDAAFEGGWRT